MDATTGLQGLLALRTSYSSRTWPVGWNKRAPRPSTRTRGPSSWMGAACEKVKNDSRWMATRYAIIRRGIECGAILLLAIASSNNPADVMTKSLPRSSGRPLGHSTPPVKSCLGTDMMCVLLWTDHSAQCNTSFFCKKPICPRFAAFAVCPVGERTPFMH